MYYLRLLLIVGFLATFDSYSQVGIGTVSPEESSILDVESTTKGFLPPRLANNTAVANPATGLIIYNEATNCLEVNVGTPSSPDWTCLSSAGSSSGGGSGSAGGFGAFPWKTTLRFDDMGLTRSSNRYYGVTADKNLFMGGAGGARNSISNFNGIGVANTSNIVSPKFLDFNGFNGKVKKITGGRDGYTVLTTDNKVYLWGFIGAGVLDPSNTSLSADATTTTNPTPTLLPLMGGETGYTDAERASNVHLYLLGASGKAYFRGYFNGVASNGQIAFPSTGPNVDGSFYYTKIVGRSSHSVYLEGSNGRYYAASRGYTASNNHTGNASAPSSPSNVNISQSSNIWEVQFPAGTGTIEKIEGLDAQVYTAIATDGKAYGWGKVSSTNNSDYYYIFSSATLTSPAPSTASYIKVPLLLNFPPGETSFKDIGSDASTTLSFYVGGSGKVYVITKPRTRTNPNSFIFVNDYNNNDPYKLIPTAGPIKKIDSFGLGTILLSEEGEILQIAIALSGHPYHVPGVTAIYNNIIPTPLLHQGYDPLNTNKQETL